MLEKIYNISINDSVLIHEFGAAAGQELLSLGDHLVDRLNNTTKNMYLILENTEKIKPLFLQHAKEEYIIESDHKIHLFNWISSDYGEF